MAVENLIEISNIANKGNVKLDQVLDELRKLYELGYSQEDCIKMLKDKYNLSDDPQWW